MLAIFSSTSYLEGHKDEVVPYDAYYVLTGDSGGPSGHPNSSRSLWRQRKEGFNTTHLSSRKELCRSVQDKSQEAENEGRSTDEVLEKGSALATWSYVLGGKPSWACFIFFHSPQSSQALEGYVLSPLFWIRSWSSVWRSSLQARERQEQETKSSCISIFWLAAWPNHQIKLVLFCDLDTLKKKNSLVSSHI